MARYYQIGTPSSIIIIAEDWETRYGAVVNTLVGLSDDGEIDPLVLGQFLEQLNSCSYGEERKSAIEITIGDHGLWFGFPNTLKVMEALERGSGDWEALEYEGPTDETEEFSRWWVWECGRDLSDEPW